jgi:hypothetical protein
VTVRAKFQLTAIKTFDYGGQELTFSTRYDNTIPEDQRFQKATPTGSITMLVDNPVALEQFKMGESYYVDFNPVIVAPTPEQ